MSIHNDFERENLAKPSIVDEQMKRLVTEFKALDIRQLARGGYLYPWSQFEWVWRQHRGTQRSSVRVTMSEDTLELTYLLGTNQVRQAVPMTYSIWYRGVKRPWFMCPTCHRRVAVLYHHEGLPFRCRRCSNLAYPTQYPSRDQSYGRRQRCLPWTEQERCRQMVGV